MSGNCGNMSAAIGPFAVDEGLIAAADGRVTVRIHNTNTRKIIHSTFEVRDGRALQGGEFAIPGVAGTGAPIRLEFLEPGGAITGKLLPTGDVIEELDVPGVGRIDVSMVDAGNACAFVRAESLGLTGSETPEQLERDTRVMEALLAIRAQASVAMGITPDIAAARAKATTPSIGIVAGPRDWTTLAWRSAVGRRGGPGGAHDLEQPAAPRAAADGVAVRCRGRQPAGFAGPYRRPLLLDRGRCGSACRRAC
jgi:2-methylaconitate cis-trans-isomerase PrpF